MAHNSDVGTILDPDLKKHQTIWAAAETLDAVFEWKPHGLDRMNNCRWVPLAE